MPVVRTYRGRRIKRTHRFGHTIEVYLETEKGRPSEVIRIPFSDYEREVLPHNEHTPALTGRLGSTVPI
jgi:hypothetical protein